MGGLHSAEVGAGLLGWCVSGGDKFGADSGEAAPCCFLKLTSSVYGGTDTIQSKTCGSFKRVGKRDPCSTKFLTFGHVKHCQQLCEEKVKGL
jgi:hypothetical protein